MAWLYTLNILPHLEMLDAFPVTCMLVHAQMCRQAPTDTPHIAGRRFPVEHFGMANWTDGSAPFYGAWPAAGGLVP